jgi:hypothetical protein
MVAIVRTATTAAGIPTPSPILSPVSNPDDEFVGDEVPDVVLVGVVKLLVVLGKGVEVIVEGERDVEPPFRKLSKQVSIE